MDAAQYISTKRGEVDALIARAHEQNVQRDYSGLDLTVSALRASLVEMEFCQAEGRPPRDDIEVMRWSRRRMMQRWS